jgi:hypothetical protein
VSGSCWNGYRWDYAIQAAYNAYKASGAVTDLQKLQAALTEVRTNLPAELAVAHISDPEAVAVTTAWVLDRVQYKGKQ